MRKLSEEHKRKISESMKGKNKGRKFSEETRNKISKSLTGRCISEETKIKIGKANKGNKHSINTKNKISKSMKGKNHHNWKGGASYDEFYDNLSYVEKIRRCFNDDDILEVKCAYCGKWYTPSRKNIINRIRTLEGKQSGENRLYCSDSCKRECPIYHQILYPKGYKKMSSREVQPELRQMVFERDNWTCQKCRSTKSLHCHHVEGIRWMPLESADIDKCITYCRNCHIEVHKKDECGYQDMQCREVM